MQAETGTTINQGPGGHKHRFEKFSHTKTISTRKQQDVYNVKDGQSLEQSGIYQINFNSINEGDNDTVPKENIKNSAKSRHALEKDSIGRVSRRQKWRDNCKCMRCEIMKRQFQEGDMHYSKWGIYPCQQLNRKKYFDHYFYDSD